MIQNKITIGVVGLGLMGSSIATCILSAGHPVIGLVKSLDEKEQVRGRILEFLQELQKERLLKTNPHAVLENLLITDQPASLVPCRLIIESIFENITEKKAVYRELELHIGQDVIIGSNTSAIPVSLLQSELQHPERFLGLHWAEPAHITRFMEIICGDRTDPANALFMQTLAETWGKEPSLVRKDIRGFITNRIMYAMIREAFHLVEGGYATYEDVDRSLRNDLGAWITFAGPFRFMDLTGIPAYAAVMQDLLPELDNSMDVPAAMKALVDSGAKGTSNASGFYPYDADSARDWERRFIEFSYDIRQLSEKYRQNI